MDEAQANAVEALLTIADAVAHIHRWCTINAREILAGRVPDWDAERTERRADLRRLLIDLEALVDRSFP